MNREAQRLNAALDVTQRAARRLRSSLEDDRDMLADAIARRDVEMSTDLLRVLDAFVQRYQQLLEHMTHRLYPAIYRAEELGERPPPALMLFRWLENGGLIDSAKLWFERAEIRNRLVHEYPLDASERKAALQAAVRESALILAQLDRAIAHTAERGLSAR